MELGSGEEGVRRIAHKTPCQVVFDMASFELCKRQNTRLLKEKVRSLQYTHVPQRSQCYSSRDITGISVLKVRAGKSWG